MDRSDGDILRLIFRAGAMARRDFGASENEKKQDLSCQCHGKGRILNVLSKNDGLSQKEIAQILVIRPQSLSESIISLEENGYIERRTNDADKRETLVFITEKGRKRALEISENREKHAKEYLSSLSQEEKESLFSLLEKIIESNI